MSLLSEAIKSGITKENKTKIFSVRMNSDHFEMLENLKKALSKGSKKPSTAKIFELLLEDASIRLKQMQK